MKHLIASTIVLKTIRKIYINFYEPNRPVFPRSWTRLKQIKPRNIHIVDVCYLDFVVYLIFKFRFKKPRPCDRRVIILITAR